jgi:hypothetical protein
MCLFILDTKTRKNDNGLGIGREYEHEKNFKDASAKGSSNLDE